MIRMRLSPGKAFAWVLRSGVLDIGLFVSTSLCRGLASGMLAIGVFSWRSARHAEIRRSLSK